MVNKPLTEAPASESPFGSDSESEISPGVNPSVDSDSEEPANGAGANERSTPVEPLPKPLDNFPSTEQVPETSPATESPSSPATPATLEPETTKEPDALEQGATKPTPVGDLPPETAKDLPPMPPWLAASQVDEGPQVAQVSAVETTHEFDPFAGTSFGPRLNPAQPGPVTPNAAKPKSNQRSASPARRGAALVFWTIKGRANRMISSASTASTTSAVCQP